MFPEYRELITKLKSNDAYFDRLFEKHNELDHEIKNMQEEKLRIKDELYEYLKKKSQE